MKSLLKELAEETVVIVKSPKSSVKVSFPMRGTIRLVDKGGSTLGLVMDRETLEEIEEEIESSSPEFLAAIEASRQTGRVSGRDVKKKAGL